MTISAASLRVCSTSHVVIAKPQIARWLAIGALCFTAFAAQAADLFNGTPTAIVEPECLTDPTGAFVVEAPPPEDRFTLVVRHMGVDAIDARPAFDFGTFAGFPMTGLSVPQPRNEWQRARVEADPNFTSAFQVHCFDAGLFINTWRFEPEQLIDEGPHAVYGYAFSHSPAAFDADPATDLVIQAQLEVPWLYRPQGSGVAQTYFQIRFYDVTTARFFQMTMLLHQNTGVEFAAYADYARNDSLFVATPAVSNAVITRSPYSAVPSAGTWTGLRFFRAQLTQANFREAVDLANRFCRARDDVPDCALLPGRTTALSADPLDYQISEFAVITEVFNADTDRNGLSLGLHIRALGLYRFR